MATEKADFPTFFWLWAQSRGWTVPDFHIRVADWMEHRGPDAVLMIFRGAGKSTILAIYNAWRMYRDPTYRILHQGPDDGTAYKTSRDTQNVLRRHPLTRDMLPGEAKVEQWWVEGADDPRNASMYARGILSNVTSSRADEVQNDDVEVPRNIQTAEARDKLRYRLGEQTHIAVPGARTLYIGTPHTHDSLYQERIRKGADALIIRLFEQEARIEHADKTTHLLTFRPDHVFVGIGEGARLLTEGRDYLVADGGIVFKEAPRALVDCYRGCAWPERFDRAELAKRRRECRTVNEWDSQYQLHAKPITEVRLDPDRLRVYDVEPAVKMANGEAVMWLGKVRIVGASCRWDPSSGKTHSDVSSVAVVFQDELGRRYWHRSIGLTGDVAAFGDDGKTITGGQVQQLVEIVRSMSLRRVTVETNGIGGFAPAVLRAALKQAKLADCGVVEVQSTVRKERRILEALEDPLRSGTLWAHRSVVEGPAARQMREWNPAATNQPDDYLDSVAGAITDAPERIGRVMPAGWNPPRKGRDDWRPGAGMYEVELEG